MNKKAIFEKAKRIVESDLPWDTKFKLIFEDEHIQQISFPWCDPDMDYEDDVKAWWKGFQEYMEKEAKIDKIIKPFGEMSTWQKEQAIHSMRYLFSDLSYNGWEKIAEITGLPMGVVVEAKNNLFCNENTN